MFYLIIMFFGGGGLSITQYWAFVLEFDPKHFMDEFSQI